MSRGTDIAASALSSAAVAANAVPVWGQFASAGLAIAAGFTKLFGNIEGPRKKKRARAKQQMMQRHQGMQQTQMQANMQGAGGQLMTGQTPPMPTTTLQAAPQAAPVFGQTPPTQMNGPQNG